MSKGIGAVINCAQECANHHQVEEGGVGKEDIEGSVGKEGRQ